MELNAFDLVGCVSELQDKDKSSCLEFDGRFIFIGTQKGKIQVYQQQHQTDHSTGRTKHDTKLVHIENPAQGKKPIRQLLAVNQLSLLLALCGDGRIAAYKVTDIGLQRKTDLFPSDARTKNVERMCLNVDSDQSSESSSSVSVCRLAIVAAKKYLVLMEFARDAFELVKEIVIASGVCDMQWHRQTVCLANKLKKQYVLVDVDSGASTDMSLMPCDKASLGVQLVDDEIMLQGNEKLGLFMTFSGQPANKSPIAWTQEPLAVIRCNYYLVGALPGGNIEIFSLLDQQLVQVLDFDRVRSLAVHGQHIICASETKVGALFVSPLEKQVRQFLDALRIQEALSLLVKKDPPPTKDQFRDFHTEAGFALFKDLQFFEAMDHFEISSVDPRTIISLFPSVCVKSLMFDGSHPSAPPHKIRRVIQQGRDKKQQRKMMANMSGQNPEVSAADQFSSMLFDDFGSSSSSSSRDRSTSFLPDQNPRESGDSRRRQTIQHQHRIREEKILSQAEYEIQALVGLARYLWRRRTQPVEGLELTDSEVKLAVDTALLMLSVECQQREVPPKKMPFELTALLFPSNDCFLSECEVYLMHKKQFNGLAQLYASKNQSRKALQVWSRIGAGEYVDNQHTGVDETVALLAKMDDEHILWRFVEWVLERDARRAMRVFTADKRAQPLSPDKVLEFLLTFANNHQLHEFPFVAHFLEHLIGKVESADPKYHNQLALLYLKAVLSRRPATGVVAAAADQDRPIPGTEAGELGVARAQLMKFLKTSTHYDVTGLLSHVEETTLFEELIVLHESLQQHRQVLRVYVEKLLDHEAAANYCKAALTPQEQSQRFLTLLELYFYPDQSSPAQLEDNVYCAMDVLELHGRFIEPQAVLELLPRDISVDLVAVYFEQQLPRIVARRRNAQMGRQLAKSAHINAQLELNEVRNSSVVVSRSSRCCVCGKPLGDSICKLYPGGGQLVHYGCAAIFESSSSAAIGQASKPRIVRPQYHSQV